MFVNGYLELTIDGSIGNSSKQEGEKKLNICEVMKVVNMMGGKRTMFTILTMMMLVNVVQCTCSMVTESE